MRLARSRKEQGRIALAGVGLGIVLWIAVGLIHLIITGKADHMAVWILHGAVLLELLLFIMFGVGFWLVYSRLSRAGKHIERLAHIVEQSPDAMMIVAVDSTIEYVNPRFSDLTGYTPDEVLGNPYRFMNYSDVSPGEEYTAMWQRVVLEGEWRGEFRNVRKNGEHYWESILIVPLRDDDDRSTRYLVVRQDITAHKAAQDAGQQQRVLAEALRDTAAAINSTLELDEVLERILINLDQLIPHSGATVALVEDGTLRVVRCCVHVSPQMCARLLQSHFVLDDLPLLRRMVESGQPQLIDNMDEVPDDLRANLLGDIQSYVGAPIRHGDEVIGILGLYASVPHYFDAVQADLLQSFADQAAIAIRNARLFNAEREQRALAETLRDTAAVVNSSLQLEDVLHHILASVEQIVPHDAANIMLIEDDTARLVGSRGYAEYGSRANLNDIEFPISSTLGVSQMIRTQQPVIVGDTRQSSAWVDVPETRWVRAYLGTPIISPLGKVIGIMSLDAATPHAFTAAHADLLQTFAHQAAIALQNAQRYDAIHGYAAQLAERVTDRTEQLERQQAQLQVILDSLGEGVAFIQGAEIRYVNRALVTMLGLSQADILGDLRTFVRSYLNAPGDSDARNAEVQAALQHGEVWHSEGQARHAGGSTFDVALTVAGVYGEAGERVGSVLVVRDISQEKQFQEQRDHFLTYAAHDFRTPVSNIKTRLYLLRQQPQRLEYHLDVMDQVSGHLVNLIEDLLDVVRFGRKVVKLEREHIPLQDVIQNSIALESSNAERKNVRLVYELPDEPVIVDADRYRIGQVIAKLINNAVFHSPAGSYVTLRLTTEDDVAQIEVQDSGPGIDPEHQPRIFEPFFQLPQGSSQGLGLGLAVSREIIGQHGGDIAFDSEPGAGAVFTIRLALVNEPQGVSITVIKNDHTGREVWRYAGRVLARGATWVTLEAHFNRSDVETGYHTFRQGDRFVEWFYSDRWYNVFAMHDVDDDRLKGWYCNITRPAELLPDVIRADDLALDVFVSPQGDVTVLDRDEFAALPLDDATRAGAERGLAALQARIAARRPPFDALDCR